MPGLAIPVPYQWQVGDTGNAALLNAQLFNGLTFLLNPPLAVYAQSASQTFTTGGSAVALTWGTPTADTYGGYNAANPTRYTAQVPGWYQITVGVSVGANATGNRDIEIHKNGVTTAIAQNVGAAPTTTNNYAGDASGLVYLNGVTDYVEGCFFQSSGASLSTIITATYLNALWIHT